MQNSKKVLLSEIIIFIRTSPLFWEMQRFIEVTVGHTKIHVDSYHSTI